MSYTTMRYAPHINELFYRYKSMRHITHECGMLRIWMSHITHVWMSLVLYTGNDGIRTMKRGRRGLMSHVWITHVTRMNESCHTYEWVMLYTWMSDVTRMNESCLTHRQRRHSTNERKGGTSPLALNASHRKLQRLDNAVFDRYLSGDRRKSPVSTQKSPISTQKSEKVQSAALGHCYFWSIFEW